MKKLILVLLLIYTHNIIAQNNNMLPDIYVRGLGKQSFVSKVRDSISVKGLENIIDIEFKKSSDSIFYQLIDYDKKEFSSVFPKIRYTNLSGGDYELRYRFSSQKDYQKIKIHIEEAIWQKWWFFPMIIFYILLLAGIGVYFFTLYNFRQKMKMEQLRNKISADLHDEVGSNLSSIAIYTQILKKSLKNSEFLPILDKITANSKESVTLMQDTVWAINPKNDSTDQILKRLENYARDVISEKNISYFQSSDMVLDKLKLNMEDRKNLYLIFKEGINNIVKHSEATKASLEVIEKGNYISIILTDNGQGFNVDKSDEGNGLRNFKERAEASGFKLNIDSEKGEGTTLSIHINH